MNYKHALLYLYDTCNLNCGYCNLAKDGFVKDFTQRDFFKELSNIDKIIDFFHIDNNITWEISLTGGEPLLMPNFDYFISNLSNKNIKISMYTNLTLTKNAKNFKYIISNSSRFQTIFATMHPEKINELDIFFEKIKILKEHRVPVIVKLIMAPKLLHLLKIFNQKCKELDVSFMPMPLLTKNYPQNYTPLEEETIRKYICTEKQIVHLFGGFDVSNSKCKAGNKILNIDARSGNIYPCADIYTPSLNIGNIYEKRVEYINEPVNCLKNEKVCLCDIHYEHDILDNFSENIEHLQKNYTQMFTDEKIDSIIKQKNLKQTKSSQINVREDNIIVFKETFEEKKELKQLRKICKERLELINYLSSENEKRLDIINKLEETIKSRKFRL